MSLPAARWAAIEATIEDVRDFVGPGWSFRPSDIVEVVEGEGRSVVWWIDRAWWEHDEAADLSGMLAAADRLRRAVRLNGGEGRASYRAPGLALSQTAFPSTIGGFLAVTPELRVTEGAGGEGGGVGASPTPGALAAPGGCGGGARPPSLSPAPCPRESAQAAIDDALESISTLDRYVRGRTRVRVMLG